MSSTAPLQDSSALPEPGANTVQLPGKLALYFDGAAEPTNPGVPAYGWAVVNPEDGEVVASDSGSPAEHGTNNFAEYCALGCGLRWLADRGWTGHLSIFGDSMLVIKQIRREYRCNLEHLQKLRQRCWDLLETLGGDYEATWIPREQNTFCDDLTKRVYVERGVRVTDRSKRK